MPKNNETKQSNYFVDSFNLPNPGLRSYFGKVREGSDEEYRTTFAKGSSLNQVLEEWSDILAPKVAKKWPTLWEFENDLKSKVGPMSIMKPLSERLEDIDHYYDDIGLSSVSISEQALNAVVSEFNQVRGLRVRSQDKTLLVMKKSTNSGSPYFTKRRSVIDKTAPCEVFINHDEVIQKLASKEWKAAAILGWRGQEGGPAYDDVKQRVVWMFPFAVNLCELQVYQPFKEAAQRFDIVPAWVSMESVDRRITRLFDTKGKDDVVICTDFSKFDQHFNQDMANGAKYILQHLLTNDQSSSAWLDRVFPIKYMIPLAYDYGKVRFGKHGMGSGSGGTNDDETLAHRALQYEAALSNHQRLNPNSQCLGDDGVLSYPGINVKDVIRVYTAHGQEMNASKQYISKHDCVYLRRWHHENYRVDGICVGVYSTFRALGRLMESERYYDPEVWSSKMVALRQLSILENVKYHPERDAFLEFCMKRDKFRLGLDIPGFLDNIDTIAKEATDLLPDFLGYTKSEMPVDQGLSSWWVVKALKSRR